LILEVHLIFFIRNKTHNWDSILILSNASPSTSQAINTFILVVEPDYLLDSEVFLLLVVFIPHEVFTPQKYVHSSTRGSAEGYPLCRVWGGYPPGWGVWGQAGPERGFGGSFPRWGFRGKPPEGKIAL
jgi:hypothetical protein